MGRKDRLIEETCILENLYPSLTRDEINKISDKDISRYVFSEFDEFPQNKRIITKLLEEELGIKLRHFPKIDIPQGINSPDFAVP